VIPSVPKNVHHHTNCPGTISFEGTAFTWRGSDYCCVQIASNFFATIVFPSCPVPKSGFAFGSENPSNKTSTFGHRPTLLSFTQRKSISANFIPAVNDRPVEWRTCRPDQTSRFVELASEFRTCIAEAIHFPNSQPAHQLLLPNNPDQKPGISTCVVTLARDSDFKQLPGLFGGSSPLSDRTLQEISVPKNCLFPFRPVSGTGCSTAREATRWKLRSSLHIYYHWVVFNLLINSL
jgi:hypothetical protein